MKAKLLQYLLEQGDGFVSGQQLCRYFGVSRTAVWKAIQSLQGDGFVIEAVRNRGYRLAAVPDILTKESCASRIQTMWAGKYLEVYKEIDSTNHRARMLGEEGGPHGALIVSESQTAGKGRRGRSWITSKGTSLAFSLLLRPKISPEKVSMLTLVAALAVSRAIDQTAQVNTEIKWPNDIVLHKKKICGILTEMSTELSDIHYVVVGIGINVHITDFPQELSDKATSLFLETKRHINRSEILGRVIAEFEALYDAFEKYETLSFLKKEYESKLAGMGKKVRILETGKEREGICSGITEHGSLLVVHEDQSVEEVISGEVSVRGIYGYV